MRNNTNPRVLMITSEWPSAERPEQVPFIVRQVEHLRVAGIDVEVSPFRGSRNPLNYLRAWLKLRRVYDIKQFDVIHAQFGQSGFLALFSGVPLVVTFRGSDLHGIIGLNGKYTLAGSVLRALSRYIALHAKEIILVSKHMARYLPAHLPYHVIPSGIDFELFRPMPKEEARRELDLPLDRRLVLFVGNPDDPLKRYNIAEKAVAMLKDRFDVDLVVAWGIPHKLVPAYMNACDALVVASVYEGSPNSVKEALACNLPVVSVDVGDVRQRIEAVQGCVLCQDDSPATVAEGLAEVFRTGNRVCGRDAVAELDERILTQKVISIYRSALSSKKESRFRSLIGSKEKR